MKKNKSHLTEYCKHADAYDFGKGEIVEGWCKYCRLYSMDGISSKELAAIVSADRKSAECNALPTPRAKRRARSKA